MIDTLAYYSKDSRYTGNYDKDLTKKKIAPCEIKTARAKALRLIESEVTRAPPVPFSINGVILMNNGRMVGIVHYSGIHPVYRSFGKGEIMYWINRDGSIRERI